MKAMIAKDHSRIQAKALPTRAEILRSATNSTHERLDQAIMRSRPFDSIGNYSRFLQVQHAFHRDVAPLYADPALAALFPELAAFARHDKVRADIEALGGVPDTRDNAAAAAGLPVPEALGWLYVVEGSNLGAAILYKAALKMGLTVERGASHLAETPEGRAAHWRAFKAILNTADLTQEEEARVVAGAEAAFNQVRGYVSTFLTEAA